MSDNGDEVDWHVLYRETNSHLDSLRLAVMECNCLDEAADFCKFLRWSHIIKLLKLNSCDGNLPVNGPLIESKSDELLLEVQDQWRSGAAVPRIEMAELKRISHKLDLIAGQVSRLPVPQVDVKAPPLRVIKGGKDAA